MLKGVGERTVQQLEEAGYKTIADMLREDEDRLATRTGMRIAKVRVLRLAARGNCRRFARLDASTRGKDRHYAGHGIAEPNDEQVSLRFADDGRSQACSVRHVFIGAKQTHPSGYHEARRALGSADRALSPRLCALHRLFLLERDLGADVCARRRIDA